MTNHEFIMKLQEHPKLLRLMKEMVDYVDNHGEVAMPVIQEHHLPPGEPELGDFT